MSLECYTFYSDDTVELRHHGEPTVNDQGSLLETEQGNMEIIWDSGRAASTVASQAGVLIVDGTEFTPVDTCNESSDDAPSDTDTASYGGTSSECYTFYSDGTVELSQGGAQAPSDSGTYQGLGVFGEIIWNSERPTSQVVPIGASNTYSVAPQADALIVDDVEFARVGSCY